MKVKDLISNLQHNFDPEQAVYIAREDAATGDYTALRLTHTDEMNVDITKAGIRIIGVLGPEACILWSE